MKKSITIIGSLLLLIVILTVARSAVSNSLSTSGVDLTKLSIEVDQYKRETAILEEKILEASSYTNLEASAGKQGYEPATSQVVLSQPLPMAYKQ